MLKYLQAFIIALTLSNSGHTISLQQLIDQAPAIKAWADFKSGNCFHCSPEDAFVVVNEQTYEISTFRVNGADAMPQVDSFGDLVKTLKAETHESETKSLYKEFPDIKFELWNIKTDQPKVQILIALRKVS